MLNFSGVQCRNFQQNNGFIRKFNTEKIKVTKENSEKIFNK